MRQYSHCHDSGSDLYDNARVTADESCRTGCFRFSETALFFAGLTLMVGTMQPAGAVGMFAGAFSKGLVGNQVLLDFMQLG